MNEIKRKKIFEHAVNIVYDLGYIHRADRGCYTETHGSFTYPELKLEIELDTTGQFKENRVIVISVNGQCVFEARETSFPESEDPNRLILIGDTRRLVYICLYRKGPWARLIDRAKMKNLVDRNAKQAPKSTGRKAKKPLRPQGSLSGPEARLASDLGID